MPTPVPAAASICSTTSGMIFTVLAGSAIIARRRTRILLLTRALGHAERLPRFMPTLDAKRTLMAAMGVGGVIAGTAFVRALFQKPKPMSVAGKVVVITGG